MPAGSADVAVGEYFPLQLMIKEVPSLIWTSSLYVITKEHLEKCHR